VRQIKALTAAPLVVDVHETDAIPLSQAGKHRFTRSDVAQSHLARLDEARG
jgi:aminoglycoside phosphotransferase (APT) family kinase protein